MRVLERVYGAIKELAPVLAVAMAVVVVSTVGEAAFTKYRQVGAVEHAAPEVAAAAGTDGWQTLTIRDWGVQLKVPLASEMPLVIYAMESKSNIGFTSSGLEKLGSQCHAASNALGTLTRVPVGEYSTYAKGAQNASFVTSIGGYDYAYEATASGCSNTESAAAEINREVSVLSEAISELSPIE